MEQRRIVVMWSRGVEQRCVAEMDSSEVERGGREMRWLYTLLEATCPCHSVRPSPWVVSRCELPIHGHDVRERMSVKRRGGEYSA
jgi:hypothetical protein